MGHKHEENCCGKHHDHDHECCHNEKENELDVMTLTLDDNTELECVVIGVFDVDEKEYIALLPHDEEDVFLYRYNELDDGELELTNIETEEEYEKVSNTFLSLIEQGDEENSEE